MDFTIYKEMDDYHYYLFTGTLQGSSDGTARPGRSFTDYPVHIVREKPGANYPILLGDKYSEQLGWCRMSNLSPVWRCCECA